LHAELQAGYPFVSLPFEPLLSCGVYSSPVHLRSYPISFQSCIVVLHASRCRLADSKPTYLTISCLLYLRSIILWRDSTFLYIHSYPVRVSLSWVTSPGPGIPTWAYRTLATDVVADVVLLVYDKTHRLMSVGCLFLGDKSRTQGPNLGLPPVAACDP